MQPLPPLDCHAHLSTRVTAEQLSRLGSALILAMTRNPTEAVEATRRWDRRIIWACGAHPSQVAKGLGVDAPLFAKRAEKFAIVGEIGLDRRSGALSLQVETFDRLLQVLREQPVLMSIHSSGCTLEVGALLEKHRPPGAIMHWFTGRPEQVRQFLDLGCYFSTNTAMADQLLASIPLDRLLPETDFPTRAKRTGTQPGDVVALEERLAALHGTSPEQMRRQFYWNFRRLAVSSGAIDRLNDYVTDLLLSA